MLYAPYGARSYNSSVNQQGQSSDPRFSLFQVAPYSDAIVEDVITNDQHESYDRETGQNLGYAKLRIIPDQRNVDSSELTWIPPLDTSMREIPLKNEAVMVFSSMGQKYYTKRVNITNKITESSWPGLLHQLSEQPSDDTQSQNMRMAARGGAPTSGHTTTLDINTLGESFRENPSVRLLRPYEGDVILQGRFGNTLRFGSSLFSPDVIQGSIPWPNILLSVGQDPSQPIPPNTTKSPYSVKKEDINNDLSSIWMIANERVRFEPATLNSPQNNKAHLRSTEIERPSPYYLGAQIFINSDRVVINSKNSEISLFSRSEINLSSIKSITLDSETNVVMTANNDIKLTPFNDLDGTAKNISFTATDVLSLTSFGDQYILGKRIFIGAGGSQSQPMVLGGELVTFLRQLLTALNSIPIILQGFTPIPPPFPNQAVALAATTAYGQIMQTLLRAVVDPRTAPFNSKDNFTTEFNEL